MTLKAARPLLALGAALSVMLAAPAVRAQTRIPTDPSVALPADIQRDLATIPDEGTPRPARHFPVSNEYRHDLLYPHLSGLGGAYVGVGSDQNYTMAAKAGSELLLLCDYDPQIPLVHRMYRALVSVSDTPDALIAHFAPEAQAESERIIATELSDDPRVADVVQYYRRQRTWFDRYLRRMARAQHDGAPVAWIGDAQMYARIRALHRARRIQTFNGDVTAERTLRAIGDVARRAGTTVRVIYFSNAEQFFPYTDAFIRNMENLPTDDRAIVVRTVNHRRLVKPGPRDWHYVVQPMSDFLARLRTGAYRHSFQLVSDILAAGPPTMGADGLSHITAQTPQHAAEQVSDRRAGRVPRVPLPPGTRPETPQPAWRIPTPPPARRAPAPARPTAAQPTPASPTPAQPRQATPASPTPGS